MAGEKPEELIKRVHELEQELTDREKDLAIFREELSKANARIERLIDQVSQELKLAQLIHKNLVPTEFPNIPGFEFSTKFLPSSISGSDYFDIFEHEDPLRFGIIVATSSGYSLTALFLTILLKMTGQIEAKRGIDPSALLQKIADELIPNIQEKESASIFYGCIDRRHFELSYSLAGGVIGLHHSYQDGILTPLKSETGPLVCQFKAKFSNQSLSLNPKDRIILCSEGLRLVANRAGEIFGMERLFKAIFEGPKLGVHELRNEILYRLNRFSEGEPIPRDVTIIVLEVNDRVIKLAST